MNSNQTKGIGFIIGGVALYLILPSIFQMIGLYFIPGFVFIIVPLILIGLGIKSLVDEKQGSEEIEDYSQNVSQNKGKFMKANKVVNVTLNGGILGALADSPHNTLKRAIKKANAEGWSVRQIIPSSSGNILLYILRLALLVVTFLLFTTANGYYIIFEKIIDDESEIENDSDLSTSNNEEQISTDNLFE